MHDVSTSCVQSFGINKSSSRGLGMNEQLDFVNKPITATKFERCMNLVGVADVDQS